MKTILITGASGNMGSEVLKQIAELGKYRCAVLLRKKKSNVKLARKLSRKYSNVEPFFGDLVNYEDCAAQIKACDYIIHCAAVIPPKADHNPDETHASNYIGTTNLLKAVLQSGRSDEIKFVYIGSVAQYGNRTFKHPWGRTGDPLLPSAFDNYAASKVKAEREVLESGIKYWVSLRQSGILYDDVLLKNLSDGLMFHTGWNTPIEWATARTSGLLIKNLIEFSEAGTLPEHFWRKVYNIGNGKDARVTGFETIDRGFKLMGHNADTIFEPHWNAVRNFHCFWYADSHILNGYLDFQKEGVEDFFKSLEKKFWFFKLGKPFARLIKRFVIMPLLKNCNAPSFWASNGFEQRIRAFFGSKQIYDSIPCKWENYYLLCKNQNPDTGERLDYNRLKDENLIKAQNLLLKHGYDETKQDFELNINDMQEAAEFRGGQCLSDSMEKGNLYKPLKWRCHNGHLFEALPFSILKAGHWCPVCCTAPPWNFGEAAKHIPFYAQVWYDDHSADENAFFDENCFRDIT